MNEAPGQDESRGKASPVSPGDILAGKYRVDRILGIGGMGVVVAATHIDLLEMRAIKFMLPSYLGNAEAVERFLREARACARLKGEHVAKVHDVGRLDNGAPYMIMEYLTGADLGAEIDRRGAIPVHEAALYVLQACEALAEAHAAGIVHRDLKPENLFLSKGPGGIPSIKVLDFGISTVLGNERELRMTKTSAIMGSPYYMSPEQTRSTRDVDVRADIWSLGVILYQLVTGRLPFPGENLTEIITAVLFGPLALPSAVVPGLPEGLDHVILRCLEREIDRRYASVAELADELAPYAPAASSRSVHRISLMLPRSQRSIPMGGAPPSSPNLLARPVTSPPTHPAAPSPPSHPRAPSASRADDSVSAGTVSGEPSVVGGASGVFQGAAQSTGPTTARRTQTPVLMIAAGAALALALGSAAFFLGRGGSRQATVTLASTAPAVRPPSSAPTPGVVLPAVAVAPRADTSADIPPPPAVTMGGDPSNPPATASGAHKPPAEVVASGRHTAGKLPPSPSATGTSKTHPPAGDPFGDGRQ